MSRKLHRHDHRAPIGVVLLKLGLHVASAIVKKKLADRMEAKRSASNGPPRRA